MRCLLILALAVPSWATTYYVNVAGYGGEQEYELRFDAWATDLDKLQRATADAKVNTFLGKLATKEALKKTFEAIAKEAKPEDFLVVTLLGHGTFDGEVYKFNLTGPDMTASELAAFMDRVPAEKQMVVNTSSSSGASLTGLRKANRGVITATRNGTEKNATLFARYFIEAFRDPTADTDKNEVLTGLEAYVYADKKTAAFYETQKRLATEHPMLEDTGRGEGVRTPSAENGQGLLAARFPLLRFGSVQEAAKSPEKQKLLARREDLEGRIDKLKYEKAAMAVDDYKKQLTGLLLELAKVQEELEK
jgi:hypothetical protein